MQWKGLHIQINTQTDLILCRLERSGLRLVNFWASFQTVMIKKKTFTKMTKHTGPKKLQTKPSSVDSQQLRLVIKHTFTTGCSLLH